MKNPFRRKWHVEAIGAETGTTYKESVEKFRTFDGADTWISRNAVVTDFEGVDEPIRFTVSKR